MTNTVKTSDMIEQLHQEFFPDNGGADAANKREVDAGIMHYYQEFREFLGETGRSSPDDAQLRRMETIASIATDRRGLIEDLRIAFADAVDPVALGYVKGLNEEGEGDDDFRRFRAMLFERIVRIRNVKFWHDDRPMGEDEQPELKVFTILYDVLRFGISNAAHHSFSALEVIPRVFQGQYGRLPTAEEYGAVAESIPGLLRSIMSMQDGIFRVLLDVIRTAHWPEEEQEFGWPAYNPRSFRLVDGQIHLHPDIMDPMRRQIREEIRTGELISMEQRTGCPGRQIVPHITRWCTSSLERVFVPHMERLVQLRDAPRDAEMLGGKMSE